MVGVLEVAGYAIVGGTLGQVAVSLYGLARRRAAITIRASMDGSPTVRLWANLCEKRDGTERPG